MKETDTAKIIKEMQAKIMVEENMSVVQAAILTDNVLNRFAPAVREGALLWLQDRLTDEFQVGDISLADVRDELDVTPFHALCVMDIYLKNPDFIPRADWFLKGAWSE